MANDRRRLSAADLVESCASRIVRQSYGSPAAIDGVRIDEARVHRGTDGAFAELLRTTDDGSEGVPGFRPRQWSWSLMEPGAVKAWHLHLAQDDLWIIPPDSQLLVGLVDLRRSSTTSQERMRLTLGAGRCHRLLIPSGVAHGVANLSREPRVVIYAASHHFSPDPRETDEWRLPADAFGADFWQMDRE